MYDPQTAELLEMLEYLCTHAAECARPLCPECDRFRRARAILLEAWQQPKPEGKPVKLAPAQAVSTPSNLVDWYRAVGKLASSPEWLRSPHPLSPVFDAQNPKP